MTINIDFDGYFGKIIATHKLKIYCYGHIWNIE